MTETEYSQINALIFLKSARNSIAETKSFCVIDDGEIDIASKAIYTLISKLDKDIEIDED